ncbi:MAG: hypothetical protein IJ043_10400 [Clostridia bacterium]|nr:hypothetical protein [Clostridia bacterium]
MYDFTKIKNRADMQQIASFLLYGVCEDEIDVRSPDVRRKAAENLLHRELEKTVPKELQEDVFDTVHHYGAMLEDIYMEIGLCCGIKIRG